MIWFGKWFMNRGSRCMDAGLCGLVRGHPGVWEFGLLYGSWTMVHGSWSRVYGEGFTVQGDLRV